MGRTRFNAFLTLNRTGPTGTVEHAPLFHCSLNKMDEQWSHAPLFIHFPITRSSKELLLVTCGCTTGNDGTHHQKIVVRTLPNIKNYSCGWTSPAATIPNTVLKVHRHQILNNKYRPWAHVHLHAIHLKIESSPRPNFIYFSLKKIAATE